MEFRGVSESSLGLYLTIATPDGGNRSSDENATTELALLGNINHPPHGGQKENVQTTSGVDVEGGDAAGGGSSSQQPKDYTKLSKEQIDELEATFQQSNFIDRSTKEALAERLKMTLMQVDAWFINGRSRLRKQQSEETYMQHKQQIEALTKITDRLQRKVEKLKKRNN